MESGNWDSVLISNLFCSENLGKSFYLSGFQFICLWMGIIYSVSLWEFWLPKIMEKKLFIKWFYGILNNPIFQRKHIFSQGQFLYTLVSWAFQEDCFYMLLCLSLLLLLIPTRFFVLFSFSFFFFLTSPPLPVLLKPPKAGDRSRRLFCRPCWRVKSKFTRVRYPSPKVVEAFHIEPKIGHHWRWEIILSRPWLSHLISL